MRRKNKVKLIIGIFLVLFILSAISLPLQNVLAESDHSDDSDIETTLHTRLETNSDEIIGSNDSMSIGSYSFYQQPQLGVGTFSHDLTQVNVRELTYADESGVNEKVSGSNALPTNLTQNYTTNSIPEYTISAPMDTTISTNIDYNFTDFTVRYVNKTVNGDSTPLEWVVPDTGDHYICIDEYSDYGLIDRIGIWGAGDIDTFMLEDITMHSDEVITGINVSIYCSNNMYSNKPLYSYGSHSSLFEQYIYLPYPSEQWRTYVWNNLTLFESEFNDLEIAFKVSMGGFKSIYACYLTLTIQNKTIQSTPFQAVQLNNFKYQVLGTNYTQTFNLTCATGNYIPYKETDVYCNYYFTSTILDNYDHISDLKVLNQSLTLTFYFWFSGATFEYSMNVSWSQNEWKVPTEVDLTINGESVIDSTYNSGYVYLSTFPTTLSITADSNVFFELNITCYFTFNFDLEIISKTYLRKTFKLLSDHSIYIDTIALDSDLDIKKIYLNNDDLGSSNPNHLIPPVQMDTDNIFNLEIILAEELYRNLPYDNSRELYDEDWSDWNLGYDSDDTISSYSDGNLSSQLQAGHYPGTYSFKDEEVGTQGTDIDYVNTVSTTANTEIVYEVDGHRKVLKQTNVGGVDSHIHNFPDGLEDNGVREFWIRLTAIDKIVVLVFYEGGSARFRIKFDSDGNFKYEDSIGFNVIETYAADKWYHIKIDWDSYNTFDLYLNNSKIVNNGDFFDGMTTGLDNIYIVSVDTTCYLDAFGSDKDPNYKIGDNLYYENYMGTHDFENYDLSTNENYFGTYDFEDYSLYDEYGNYTAEHGFDLETEVGYYKGSGGLNYEIIDTAGLGIDYIDYWNSHGSIKINAGKGGHKNVLALTHDGGADDPIVDHNYPDSEISGIKEFWIATSDFTKYQHYSLNFDGTAKITISIWASKIQHHPNNVFTDTGVVPVNNTFNHIKITFDCSVGVNGQYQLYIDGVQIGGDHEMRSATTYVNKFRWIAVTNLVFSSYLDAPGLVGETDPEGYVYEPTWNINGYNIDKLLDAGYILQCALGDSHIKITDNVDGHSNVLEIYDNQSTLDYTEADDVIIKIPFGSSQEFGTVEFWIRTVNAGLITTFFMQSGNDLNIVNQINIDKFRYYDGDYHDFADCSDNIWYHVRIDFECGDGGYKGLGVDEYYIYINGVQYGSYGFYTVSDTLDNIIFGTSSSQSGTQTYIDAIDFSWSDDYGSYRNSNPYGQLDDVVDDEWVFYYFPYISISTVYENSAHNKILNITDDSNVNYVYMGQSFVDQAYGTVEYWIKTTDATQSMVIVLTHSGSTLFALKVESNKFQYYDNTGYHDVGKVATDDTWYHIQINFDCTAGGYHGLAQYDWDIQINGENFGDYDFYNNQPHADRYYWQSSTAANDYSYYIDAFSYSWDPDYSVGQNTNPYYEDLRYTGFVDDWNIDYVYNCWVNISGEYGQHKKYVELYDNNTEGYIACQKSFSQQQYGTIEYWMKVSDATYYSPIRVKGITNGFYFGIDEDKFKYWDGAWHDVGLGANDNQWYHIRLAFECTVGGYEGLTQYDWKVFINGTEYGDYDLGTNADYISNVRIYTTGEDNNYIIYIDSLSFSWEDPIGINLLKEMPEIDNPYAMINKTISSADLELYSYTVEISFTYKFTQYGAYLNATKMNDIELIDDNVYHIYSTIITTGQHSFFYTFNISNGILLLSDFNFVIENQHSIQKTINPTTSVNSVEFKEYLQTDRTFEYWYYRNIYTINNLEIEHDPSSTITSSFGYENHKYYFSQYANTDDEFTGTIDYNPNWQISFTFIVNNATYSKVKVDYGADFIIYNTTLVLDLRNSGIFDDIENPNRDNYILNIDSLSFSSTTQSLYIIGNRTQQTPNPQTDVDLVQLNEEFTYNSQVLSSSYVSVNPNWQISTSVIDKNGTYGKLEIDFKADLPLINVDLKTSVKRNNMFSDVVETKDYQNDTSIYFQLDGLSFTTDYQSTYVEGFRTLLESDITTDDIYLDYNEEYKWSSTSLSNYTVGLCPCWLVSTSVLENNGTYGKVQVDFKADLSLINVDLKFSIDRNNIFGDSVEIIGYQNTTEINFILENINFTTSLQSEVVEGFRTLLESDITTDDIYLDYNEEYKWSSISLSNYSIEIKPNWDVSFSYVYNNASYSYIQSDYSSDLDFYNVTMNLDLRNTAIFDDMDNQGKDDYLLTIEYLNFTTSTKTLYITGTRTQYTSNPQTDINIIQLNETITYNNDVLTTSLVDNDPNWQISISVIQKNATYGKLEIEYKSDATYTNVDLKTSITRNNMFDDSVEVKGYQNETTLSFELSVITFNSSFQITYIEGFRYLDEIDIHTNMSYVDYEERYYWSSVSLNNYSIEINPNWVILSSIVEYNGTYSKIKIQCKSDIAINNVTLQFSRSRNSIFGDIYELAGYQNITKIEFNLQNVNFTSLYQTTYIECFRSLTQINPNTNMTYLDFEEQYYWNSTSLSNHSIRINPNWNVGYSIISNNGTFAQLNISYYSDLFISDILLKLSLRYDDLYAENWSNNAQQSIYTYILEIPDINFTTSEQILNLTGVSSVPYCNFSSFINEDGFKLSDEEWRIKITDEEWRTITKSNWEDIEVYMYGYVQFTKYSRVFIISDMEDDWELDGVHYQGIPYDISATGYFTCEGWGSGITSAYLRFKTNPIEDLRREQTREQVIYKIKSKYDLEDVDFIFYIEEDERYNINDMIKQLKKEIDCTDIIKYYSVEDRDYYMIMDMDLDEGTNKITIYYKIENAAKYSWAFLIVGIAMIGFSIIYISYRYYDNKILDFIGLDKLVKYFFWIKKSERIKMTKKYRLNKKKKKRGKK